MSMVKVPTKRKPLLRGIDVSKWQGKIDWEKVAESKNKLGPDGEHEDIGFAIIRAACGTRVDKVSDYAGLDCDWGFEQNWRECSKTTITRGCYQYMTYEKSGIEQADALCDIIESAGGLRDLDLPPVLDVEAETIKSSTLLTEVMAWCKRIEERLGRVPIIYTVPYFWEERVTTPMTYPLWISHVKTDAPLVPTSWPAWMIWQDSWTGTVPGIHNCKVDTNVFEGSQEDLVFLTMLLIPGVYNQLTSPK